MPNTLYKMAGSEIKNKVIVRIYGKIPLIYNYFQINHSS